MGLVGVGASRPRYSLLTHQMDGWTTCDFTGFFFNIIPVISGRWEEDNIKLCALEPLLDLYMYYMYQVRGR